MPIAAIDLDGEEQKIMINWRDVNGNITKTKLVRGDFENVNKLYQSLSAGLNNKTTYDLEGTKFNATNAQFTKGFEAYKEGTANARSDHNKIRPNSGILNFDITTDAKGNQSVNIGFDNVPIDQRDLNIQALRGASKVGGAVGTGIEAIGYGAAIVPGGQGVAAGLVGMGKAVSLVGDGVDIGADLLEEKKENALIKGGIAVGGFVVGKAIDKIPAQKLTKEALDTYVGRGTGAIRDGYLGSKQPAVEESSNLNLKIDKKN